MLKNACNVFKIKQKAKANIKVFSKCIYKTTHNEGLCVRRPESVYEVQLPALNINICQGYSTLEWMFFVRCLYMPDSLKTKVTTDNYTTCKKKKETMRPFWWWDWTLNNKLIKLNWCSPTGFNGIWEWNLFFVLVLIFSMMDTFDLNTV